MAVDGFPEHHHNITDPHHDYDYDGGGGDICTNSHHHTNHHHDHDYDGGDDKCTQILWQLQHVTFTPLSSSCWVKNYFRSLFLLAKDVNKLIFNGAKKVTKNYDDDDDNNDDDDDIDIVT